jgi:hypothetical protein
LSFGTRSYSGSGRGTQNRPGTRRRLGTP